VVAVGGNALVSSGTLTTVQSQIEAIEAAMVPVASLIAMGEKVVMVHGNGPQVGYMAMRSQLSRAEIHEVPLDALVASSQGSMGYMLQRALREELKRRNVHREVMTVITEVEVDPDDQSFEESVKPVGLFFSQEEAERLQIERGWNMAEDSNRGWRQVVPSPVPLKILQLELIRSLLEKNIVVICCGGGGIPVVRSDEGKMAGVSGVIDKDRTSALLGISLGAKQFYLTTAVDCVYRDFGTENATPLGEVTIDYLKELAAQGQFPKGSMWPKIKSAERFLIHGGERVVICKPTALEDAYFGRAGTQIFREKR
jgi:carbamate kinase